MYGIHRVEKRNRQAVGSLQAEANREPGKPKNFPGSDIDWSRTIDNVRLVSSNNWLNDIDRVIKSHGIDKVRKDAVVMLDAVYTASPEFFENKSREECLEYFEKCLEFHKKHYGEVINAVVHFDETTPHMQVCSVPITADGRLSAKDIMGNIKAYTDRQDAFYEDVSRGYGLERGEKRDNGSKRKHMEQMTYKLQKEAEKAERERKDRKELMNENFKLIEENASLSSSNRVLVKKNQKLEEKVNNKEEELKELEKLKENIAKLRAEQEALEKRNSALRKHNEMLEINEKQKKKPNAFQRMIDTMHNTEWK